MDATTGESDGFSGYDGTVPDVTQIPLLLLASQGDTVLDGVIRRLVADVIEDGEITAGFGNIP